jgi:hypothetical protein
MDGSGSVPVIDALQSLDSHPQVTQRPNQALQGGLIANPAPETGLLAIARQDLEAGEGGEDAGAGTAGDHELVLGPGGHKSTLDLDRANRVTRGE